MEELIELEKLLEDDDGLLFKVTVNSEPETQHIVSLTRTYFHQFTEVKEDLLPEQLIREAFIFLLARESNTSILNSFDLQDIERYFPEFRDIYNNK